MGAVYSRRGRLLDECREARMTGLEVLLAVAGVIATALVIAGMILITPRGAVDVHVDRADAHGSNLSGAQAPDRPSREPTSV
jgi:hypothetical protein